MNRTESYQSIKLNQMVKKFGIEALLGSNPLATKLSTVRS